MSAPLRLEETSEGVLEVVLTQAPCNEIGLPMLDALEGVTQRIGSRPPRAVLLRSEVAKGFSAGADLRSLHEALQHTPDPKAREAELRSFIERIHEVFNTLDQTPIPVVAALHGVCFGGGLELALTADLRVGEPSLRVAFPELRLGLIPGFGGIPRLQRETQAAFARELLLSGRSVGIARAQSVGLVQQKAAAGEAAEVARRLLAQLLRQDPYAYAAAKAFSKPHPHQRLTQESELFMGLAMRSTLMNALDDFTSRKDALPWLPPTTQEGES